MKTTTTQTMPTTTISAGDILLETNNNDLNNFGVLGHPDEIAEIITGLYHGPKRSNEISKQIDTVSEPTVYAILKELEEKGFIQKIKKSKRQVLYNLTDRGRKIVEEEYAKAEETLIELVQNTPKHKEIVVEVLMGDLIKTKKIPEMWQTPDKMGILRNYMEREIERIEEGVINTLGLITKSAV